MDDSDDVGEEENALYDKEEENDEEDEEQDVDEVDTAKDEEEEKQEDSKVGEKTDDNKEHMSFNDTDEESDASVSTDFHPKAKKQSSDNTLKYAKKSAHNQGNVEDVMFKNLFSGDLKLTVAENVNKSSKTNSVGV